MTWDEQPALPRELQLEVTGTCNLRCRMCLVRYRPPLDRTAGSMCFHTFRSIVDAVPHLERLTLQGLGEPLMAPDLTAMIAYASQRGIEAGFNTNAMLLTRAKATAPRREVSACASRSRGKRRPLAAIPMCRVASGRGGRPTSRTPGTCNRAA